MLVYKCECDCTKCNDLNPQINQIWSSIPVNTYNISAYTCNQIQLLTTFGGSGSLECNDNTDSIEFEVLPNNYTMRTLFGNGDPELSNECCDISNPYRVCNAPDKQSDIDALCKNLGYANAYVI